MKENEPMSLHTSFKVGGPARYFEEPESVSELAQIIKNLNRAYKPYVVIGNGSNLLVSDKGYDGTIVEVGKKLSGLETEGNSIFAEAGVPLSLLAATARDHGLTGLEFASGIPGYVGGAVVMNAGAYDGEIKDVLKSVVLINPQGEIVYEDADNLDLSYRHSNIPDRKMTVAGALFVLNDGDPKEIGAKMKELNSRRIEKQPLELPSAGSFFKRPEGFFAGKLISDAGLKGYKVGGAAVSEKHAGFIINTGDASAQDIYDLSCFVIKTVKEKYGVTLEREVKLLGEFCE